MELRPFEPLRSLGPANAFGHMGAMHLLEQPKVLRFVEKVRCRDGIISPATREALKYNLNRFPEQRYIEEALPIAESH